MTDKQQRQSQILTRLQVGRLTRQEAAQLLGISPRHLQRLLADFEANGVGTLVHGNTGRTPTHKTPERVVEKIVTLAGEGGPYHDFNVCHLQQMLAQEGITLGRSTLDRLLKEQGLRKSGRRKDQRRRKRRERRAAEGLLLQIDGSLHDWLEGRGAKLCLIGAIDDATGKIIYLCFYPSESQEAYLVMLRTIATGHGLPMSLYHDKHTILRSPKAASIEEELAGKQPMSQVQRVMHELGIESIAANSPQAKGRVERLWQTLQDRLIKEMRLAGIDTREAANAFLPGFMERFNALFACPAADPEAAWVPVDAELDLAYYFCVREQRTVKADRTISFGGQCLQIVREPAGTILVGKRITVHVVPEGEVFVYQGKQRLQYRRLEPPKLCPSRSVPASVPASASPVGEAAVGAGTTTQSRPKSTARQRAWLFGTR